MKSFSYNFTLLIVVFGMCIGCKVKQPQQISSVPYQPILPASGDGNCQVSVQPVSLAMDEVTKMLVPNAASLSLKLADDPLNYGCVIGHRVSFDFGDTTTSALWRVCTTEGVCIPSASDPKMTVQFGGQTYYTSTLGLDDIPMQELNGKIITLHSLACSASYTNCNPNEFVSVPYNFLPSSCSTQQQVSLVADTLSQLHEVNQQLNILSPQITTLACNFLPTVPGSATLTTQQANTFNLLKNICNAGPDYATVMITTQLQDLMTLVEGKGTQSVTTLADGTGLLLDNCASGTVAGNAGNSTNSGSTDGSGTTGGSGTPPPTKATGNTSTLPPPDDPTVQSSNSNQAMEQEIMARNQQNQPVSANSSKGINQPTLAFLIIGSIGVAVFGAQVFGGLKFFQRISSWKLKRKGILQLDELKPVFEEIQKTPAGKEVDPDLLSKYNVMRQKAIGTFAKYDVMHKSLPTDVTYKVEGVGAYENLRIDPVTNKVYGTLIEAAKKAPATPQQGAQQAPEKPPEEELTVSENDPIRKEIKSPTLTELVVSNSLPNITQENFKDPALRSKMKWGGETGVIDINTNGRSLIEPEHGASKYAFYASTAILVFSSIAAGFQNAGLVDKKPGVPDWQGVSTDVQKLLSQILDLLTKRDILQKSADSLTQ